ncbi:MAG: fibronectin type III domain-containing protein [Thermoplasmatota archaeon]
MTQPRPATAHRPVGLALFITALLAMGMTVTLPISLGPGALVAAGSAGANQTVPPTTTVACQGCSTAPTNTTPPSSAGGSLQIVNETPSLVRFIQNGPPYGTPPTPCTVIGPTQTDTYRIVTFPDRTGSTIPGQPITKVVFSVDRDPNGRKFIQWIPVHSNSYIKDASDPTPVFPNVTYEPGGAYKQTVPVVNPDGTTTYAAQTFIRPDRLIFTGGSMDHGGNFKIAFSVIGRPATGAIFPMEVRAYYADGLNGLMTNVSTSYWGGQRGLTVADTSTNPTTYHNYTNADVEGGVQLAGGTFQPDPWVPKRTDYVYDSTLPGSKVTFLSRVTDLTTCAGGPPSRPLEFRVDSTAPAIRAGSVEVFDMDHNGHIDHMQLSFTKPIDVGSFDVSRFLISRIGSATEPNLPGTSGRDVRNYVPILPLVWEPDVDGVQHHNTINITLRELPYYDTGDMPGLLCTSQCMTDIAGNQPRQVTFSPAGVIDRAPPVLISATAYDGAPQMILTFSEGVYGSWGTADTNGSAIDQHSHTSMPGLLGCPASPANGPLALNSSYKWGAVLRCDFDYFDGTPDFNTSFSQSADNCVRSAVMDEFLEPDPNVSPAGSSIVVFPLDPQKAPHGFCNKDVNWTSGWNDWIRPRHGIPNSQYGVKDNMTLNATGLYPNLAYNKTDLRPVAGTLYDFAGNQIWVPPSASRDASANVIVPNDVNDPDYTTCRPGDTILVSGDPVHDDTLQLGPEHAPGKCRNYFAKAVPVIPPRVTWVEADNGHNVIVAHFSTPLSNVTGNDVALPIAGFDIVTSTGGGAGGVQQVQHVAGTSEVVLTLDHAVNQNDIGDNPSFLRIRCDPNYGAPWSWLDGSYLPTDGSTNLPPTQGKTTYKGDNLLLHAHAKPNQLADGRPIPSQVTARCGDYPLSDHTPPRILWANTTDLDNDGIIDAYALTFSEPVDDSTFCQVGSTQAPGTCSAQVLGGQIALGGPGAYVNDIFTPTPRADVELQRSVNILTNFTWDTGKNVNDNFGYLRWHQDFNPDQHNHHYTDIVPDLTTRPNVHLFRDLSDPVHGSNVMRPIDMFDVQERDGAGPRILKAETIDTPLNKGTGSLNQGIEGDGFIDSYRLTFSERVDAKSFTACEWRVAGHNVTGVGAYGDPLGDPAGLLSNDRQILVHFLPDKTNPFGDTDAVPQLTYVKGGVGCPRGVSPNGFKDILGNAMQTFGVDDVHEQDGAPPSITSIIAYPGNANMTVVFSEPVEDANGKWLLWRDFQYADNNHAGAQGQSVGHYDPNGVYHPPRDANQNTLSAIDQAQRTHTDPPQPMAGTRFVLMPLDAPLTSTPTTGLNGVQFPPDIGSDFLSAHLGMVRESAPGIPPPLRQFVSTVPHGVGIAPDVTPPGGIQDLSINGAAFSSGGCGPQVTGGGVTANSVRLQWHAPGDDDYANGPVAGYTVKVSTSQITPDIFDSIDNTQVGSLTMDYGAGIVQPNSIQTVNVVGLNHTLTTYYFAVRAFDHAGNLGPVSNSCSAMTLQDQTPPEWAASPTVTSADCPSGKAGPGSSLTFTWSTAQDPESTVLYRYALSENAEYQVLATDTQTTGTQAVYPAGSVANGTWTFSVAPYSGGGPGPTLHVTCAVGADAIPPPSIAKADQLLQARTQVVRHNGLNTVSWTLPDQKSLPGTVQAVEIWRLDAQVPVKVIVVCSGNPAEYNQCPGDYLALQHGNFTDGTPSASADSQYRADMEFAGPTGAPQVQPQTVAGFLALANGGGNGVPLWVWIVLGIALALIVAGTVIFFVLRGRQKKATREGAVAYQWTHTGEVVLDPITGLPIHDVKCPNCSVDFQAQGELPLQISCPSCGVSGVLN